MRNLGSILKPPLERNLFYIREGRFNQLLMLLPYSACKTSKNVREVLQYKKKRLITIKKI